MIENSVIGVRAQIAENVVIRNSYIMGADSYETPEEKAANARAGRPHIGIGAGSRIEDAIIDKNARIGQNVRDPQRGGRRRLGGRPALRHPRQDRRRSPNSRSSRTAP